MLEMNSVAALRIVLYRFARSNNVKCKYKGIKRGMAFQLIGKKTAQEEYNTWGARSYRKIINNIVLR